MPRSKWISFGAQQSLERRAKSDPSADTNASLPYPAEEKRFGLENFGNTCYANSVLQALYFCAPFRDLLLQDVEHTAPYDVSSVVAPAADKPTPSSRGKPERKGSTNGPSAGQPTTSSQPSGVPLRSSHLTLYSALQSLFLHISTSSGDKGTVAPRAFIDKLKELNELFRSTMHQDAHEFLNYLLNQIVEEIENERKIILNGVNGEDMSSSVHTSASKHPPTVGTTAHSSSSGPFRPDATLVHKLFEGTLTNETRCLTCETVSCRDESFLDLSIDIEQNSSLTACLRQFSASEMLCQKNKFFCDSCCDLQEAEKRMKIKNLPNVLALHLKRFKYQEDVGRYIKLVYRVAFPMELRLFNTVDDMDNADRLYNLFAIVVHIGNGPHHGHYVSIIKPGRTWFIFDDDTVSPLPENDIPKYFGDSNSGSAYVLYYQAVDIDLIGLGLRSPDPTGPPPFQDKFPLLDHAPAVPPGLSDLPSEDDTSPQPYHLSGSSIPTQSLHKDSSLPIISGNNLISESSQPIPRQTSPNPSPVTPTSLGRQILNTIRRAPSMSATRSTGNSVVNGEDHQRSLTDRSPRPSTSSPAFLTSVDDEPRPPVPPLPPIVLGSLQHPAPPIQAPLVNEHQEEKGKDKEKSRSGGNWFSKKRKSLKLGDKGKKEPTSTQSPSSPFMQPEDQEQTIHWFSRSNSTTSTPAQQSFQPKLGPDIDAELRADSSRKVIANQEPSLNGHDDSNSQPSGSSSPSLTSLLIHGQGTTGGAVIPSTSLSSKKSSPFLGFSIPQNGSATGSSERPRLSVDRKKSQDMKVSSRSGSTFISSTQNGPHHPPLPSAPLTNHSRTHRSLPSNDYPSFSDVEAPISNNIPQMDGDVNQASKWPLPPRHVQRSSTLQSTHQNAPLGLNDAIGNHSSLAISNDRRSIRKLSLTTPILVLGKKDREKEKR